MDDAVIGLSYDEPLDLILCLEQLIYTLLDRTVGAVTEVDRTGNKKDLLALGERCDGIADALDRTGGNADILHIDGAENFGVFLLLHDLFKLTKLCRIRSDQTRIYHFSELPLQ